MTRQSKFTLSLFVVLAVWFALSPTLAGERMIEFRVDEPIIIGDQVYAGGEIVLAHLRISSLLELRINGQHIGLLQNTGWGRRPHGSKPYLVCTRRSSGFLQMDHIVFKGSLAEPAELKIRVQAVALRPGIMPIPGQLPQPETAVAAR